MTKKNTKHKYRVGDIVGICSDAMYEFKITACLPKKRYAVKCVKSYTKTIKVGDKYGAEERQIVCLLRPAKHPKTKNERTR